MTIRILHILANMGMERETGVPSWLMQTLRRIDRQRFHIDILVQTSQLRAYDDEVRALGSDIISSPSIFNPMAYARNFRRINREHGPYDIVHCHLSHYSGYTLRVAHQARVRGRIAHTHINTSWAQANKPLYKRMALSILSRWIDKYATVGLAVSQTTAADLYGPDWAADGRWRVLPNGIDLAPFQQSVDSRVVRSELGIPEEAFVVGHVGVLRPVKNHTFLIDIMAEVARRRPDTWFLLVGTGHLREAIKHKVKVAGLADRTTFSGVRNDIPRVMLGAIDVFVLPSLSEGRSRVFLETQAAGVPSVVSAAVPEGADVVKSLVRRLSVSRPAADWAETVLSTQDSPDRVSQPKALAAMLQSPYTIENSVHSLEEIYTHTLPPNGMARSVSG